MSKTITILIADDHAIVREGLAAILGYQKDLSVVGQAVDGREAARQAARLRPDVVLLDLMMPVMDGADSTAAVKKASPASNVLILTTFGTSAKLAAAFENGATGAITKNLPKEALFDAIRKTAAGIRVVSHEIEQTLQEEKDATDLTPRQREILASLCRGLTNQDLSLQFNLSLAGIKFNLATIFRKLGVANRAEAIALTLRKQLLEIS